jgi:hypothetical protein
MEEIIVARKMSESKIVLTCESCDVFSFVPYLRVSGVTLLFLIGDLCCLRLHRPLVGEEDAIPCLL